MKNRNHEKADWKSAITAHAPATAELLAMLALLSMFMGFHGKYACMLSGVTLSALFWALFRELRGPREKTGVIVLFYRVVLTLGMGLCVIICVLWVGERVFGELSQRRAYVAVNVLETLLALAVVPVPFVVMKLRFPADEKESGGFPALYMPVRALFLPIFAVIAALGYAAVILSVVDGSVRISAALYTATSGVLLYAALSLCLQGDRSRAASAFVRWGWAALIPVLILYVIGAKIRLERYGLTTPFYASMLIVGHCVVMIAMMRLGMPVRRFFALAAVSSLVFTFTPLGTYQLPMTQQQGRLQRLLEENGLYKDGVLTVEGEIDETLLVKIHGLSYYLSRGKDDFDTALMRSAVARDDDEFAKLYGYVPNGAYRYTHFNNYSSKIDETGFDAQGYSHVVPVRGYVSEPKGIVIEYTDMNGGAKTADLTQYAMSLPEQYGEECFTCDLRFAVDENTTLVFEYIDYKTYQGTVQWYQYSGYALLR